LDKILRATEETSLIIFKTITANSQTQI